jgi:acetolactate synthase-1/2/3 large subunit
VAKFSWRKKPGNTAKRRAKTPKRFELARAAELINGAKKPLILAGHGVIIAGAERELIELAERAEIPVACTLHGLASFAKTHPLYAGFLGMHGNYAPNLLTNQADVILAVGMRFDDRVTGKLSEYAKQAKIIHFEIDPTQVNRLVPVEVALIADVKDSITSLLPLIEKTERPEWRGEFQALHAREHEAVIAQAIRPEGGELKMSEAISALSELTKGEAVVVADVGQHQMMAARYYEFARPRSMISSGGLGTMGFALPAAMGAKIASPDREVVAIIGDGGFQMTFQELGTVAQEQLAVKMVILNNSYLGMVRQWQELFFDRRYSFVEINSPNLVQLAGAFSIPAERVDAREELHSALQRMLDAKGPYLLEVVVEQEQNVFPMVPAGAGLNDTRLE